MPRVDGSYAPSNMALHQDDGRTYLVDGSIIHGVDPNGNQLIWEHKEPFTAVTELTEVDFQRMRKSGFLKLKEEFMTPEELAAQQAALAASFASEREQLLAEIERLRAEASAAKPSKRAEP